MANPQKNDDFLDGLRRANRDDEQHAHYKGFETIEGGRNAKPDIGADLTRDPFDESLVRDANGNLIADRTDVLRGYGEPRAERNYPRAFDRDELINTDLNPAMEYPRRTTVTFKIVAIALGLVTFALILLAMFWNDFPDVKRSPERPNQGHVTAPAGNTLALQQFATFVHRANERRN